MKKSLFIKIISVFCLLLVLCGSLVGCNSESTKNDSKIKVAVSIIPEETFVKWVAGDLVSVITLIPNGASPENYEPTAKQMANFENSLLYFSIGVPTEEANILPRVSKNTKTVSLAEQVSAVYPDLKVGNERDPHIWLSPKRVIVMLKAIANELSLLTPENKLTYTENAEKYINKLELLDSQLRNELNSVEKRKFIAFHPAFAYFADDYSLEMYALEEHGKEVTPKHIEEMVDFAKAEGITAVFYQAETDSHQAKAFAENIGGKTVLLSPLSADYIENLKTMANLIGRN